MIHYLLATLLMLLALGATAQTDLAVINPFKAMVHVDQKIVLLNNGLAALEERLQMIERAQKTIDVEYFIYSPDKAGRIFTHALLKKADQGIKVRLLLDWFKVQSQLSPFYAYELEKHGIEIKYYNPTSVLNFFKYQYRNHRKTLLIDGKEVITGGRNLADEYFDLHESYNFLDRDIKVEGNLVQSVQNTFNEMWNSKLSKHMDRARKPNATDSKYNNHNGSSSNGDYTNDLKLWENKVSTAEEFVKNPIDENIEREVREKGKSNLAEEYSGLCQDMSFQSEYPIIGSKSKDKRLLKFTISEKMKKAEKSIIFDSPYFVLDKTTSDALNLALKNKLDVKLITNSLYSSDAVYVSTAFNAVVKSWIARGLKPYVLDGQRPVGYEKLNDEIGAARVGVHAKSYVFDDKDTIIGTYNFDPRSANLNAEMIVSCENNPELANAVTKDMEMRMKSSIFLDSAKAADKFKFYNVGLLKKLEFFLLKIPSQLAHSLL